MSGMFSRMLVNLIVQLNGEFPNNCVIHNTYRLSVGCDDTDVVSAFRTACKINPGDTSPGVMRLRKLVAKVVDATEYIDSKC